MDFNPALLSKLLDDDLGWTTSVYTSDMKPSFVARCQLRQSLLKKFTTKESSDLRSKAAIDTFMDANQRCKEFVLQFEGYEELCFEYWKSGMASAYFSGDLQMPILSWHEVLAKAMPGPGTSIGTKHTAFFGKMWQSPYSMTSPHLYDIYRAVLSPTWRDADNQRHSWYGEEIVSGSKLEVVPKNESTDRTICVEPSLNMFFQKGIGSTLERLLKTRHNIDLAKQQHTNRALARKGSVDESLATLDLSAASDSISLKLLAELLPKEFLNFLLVTRSPETSVRGEPVELHMVSSMGNGFTFPLMTLMLAELVVSVYQMLGIHPERYGENRNYGVNGDDIIVSKEAVPFIIKMLTKAGFRVNETKSYTSGYFRESCGGDYWKGHPVRGVYLTKVDHEQDIYSSINRLLRWVAFHRILLPRTISYLRGLCQFRPVPLDASDVGGIKVPECYLTSPKRGVHGGILYREYVPVVKAKRVREDEISTNASAVAISLIGGLISGPKGQIDDYWLSLQKKGGVSKGDGLRYSTRSKSVAYKIVRSETSSWDWNPYVGFTIQDYTWAVLICLP